MALEIIHAILKVHLQRANEENAPYQKFTAVLFLSVFLSYSAQITIHQQ